MSQPKKKEQQGTRMKQLSEFTGEKAITVVADLLDPIAFILANPENAKMKEAGGKITILNMFKGFMKNSPKQFMTIFAILSEEDPEKYNCSAAEALVNLVKLTSDPELLGLFS